MELWAILNKLRSARPNGGDITSRSQYRGVQVNGSPAGCCMAVRRIAGQRYLSHEIPKLPLEDCNLPLCQCSYQLFEDRRTGRRRGQEFRSGVGHQFRSWDDRNSPSPGRRHDD